MPATDEADRVIGVVPEGDLLHKTADRTVAGNVPAVSGRDARERVKGFMPGGIVDGAEETETSARWAADEAVLRSAGVHPPHARQPWPDSASPMATRESEGPWAEELVRRTAEGLRERHPGPSVTRVATAGPVQALVAAAE